MLALPHELLHLCSFINPGRNLRYEIFHVREMGIFGENLMLVDSKLI